MAGTTVVFRVSRRAVMMFAVVSRRCFFEDGDLGGSPTPYLSSVTCRENGRKTVRTNASDVFFFIL